MEPSDSLRHTFLTQLGSATSLVAVLITLMVIGAWWSGNIDIASVDEGYVPMTLSVALSVLLLAVAALISLRFGKRSLSLWLPSAMALVALLLSFWVLFEFLAGRHSEIDRLLGAGIGTAGGYELAQSSPLSILTLLAASIAAFISFNERIARKYSLVAVALSSFIVATGAIITLGYAYGSPLLYGGSVRPVAVLSGICYVLLGTVLLCALGPDMWPVSAFMGNSVKARLLRSFLPIVVVMVLVSGSLSNRMLSTSSNPALTAVMIALATAIVVGYFITRISAYVGGQIDRTNEALLRTQADLKLANEKLSTLGSITRHDALNRLSVVLGRTQLLQEMSKDRDIVKQARESYAAAQAVQRIIEFTGEYQKIGSGGPVWVDVEEAFREALGGVDLEAISVKSEVSGLEVLADRMFEKVLMNLVDNSQRHGKNLKTLRLSYRKDADKLVLVYEDDGGGLSPEDKESLFRRGHGKHTGLGTFLSKEIVEFSEMNIRETGEYGVGARFEITVPPKRYRLASH